MASVGWVRTEVRELRKEFIFHIFDMRKTISFESRTSGHG
jgi:hypothetical protein